MRPWTSRTFEALASVHLAVVTMVALGVACAAATFYEASRGTAAVQRHFYGAPWFTLLLAVLAVNILFSTLKRYPWTRHHLGFVVAHAGILLLLAGSLVSLHGGLDGRLAVEEGDSSDRLALAGEALHVGLPDGSHGVLPVRFSLVPPAPGTRLPLPGADAQVVVEEFQPHARLGEVWAEALPGQAGSPLLQLTLSGPSVAPQPISLRAGDPGQAHASFGPLSFSLHVATGPEEQQELLRASREPNLAAFVVGPDGALRYALSARSGKAAAGTAEAGDAIATPWMDLTLRVDRFMARAAPHRVVTRLPPPAKEEDRTPAVLLRVESGRHHAREWLAFSETRHVRLGEGEGHLGYGPVEASLPFRVALLDFRSDTYPGSRMAATYESRVRVDDPERGSSVHTISMNHPLHYRGYTFFQASYVDGEPATSIFSVSRAPGLPLVYLGTALMAAGVLWMSFLKRWVARRQARRALEERALGSASSAVPVARPA